MEWIKRAARILFSQHRIASRLEHENAELRRQIAKMNQTIRLLESCAKAAQNLAEVRYQAMIEACSDEDDAGIIYDDAWNQEGRN